MAEGKKAVEGRPENLDTEDGSLRSSSSEGYSASNRSSREDVFGGQQSSDESLGLSDSSDELCPLIPQGDRGYGNEREGTDGGAEEPLVEVELEVEPTGERENHESEDEREGERGRANSGGTSSGQRRPRATKISVRLKLERDSALKMEVIKQGYLMQQGRKLQRWSKRYVVIIGDRLLVSKKPEDKLMEEIVLKDVDVAENSTKNVNHSFTVLTPFQQVVFASTCRKDMDEWISALKSAAARSKQMGDLDTLQHLEGQHSWFSCSHARPTYCNVCREALHGVAWHGLSCEVCKFKSHRRCVFSATQPCKWTTRTNLEKDGVIISPDFSIPHQWLEGNIPTGSKCAVCDRACGSVRRLQDFRCMWCKITVHSECKDQARPLCALGDHCLSILPPSALQRSDAVRKGMWEPYKVSGHSPVLALVNSKSGDNQGVKFLRRLKFWLNPAQVFDLAIVGPDLGLQLFQRFEKFRVIILGGDGSIGWVLSAIDKYSLHSKCMVGMVPLGTGNDMARVLGWGAQCNDEEKLPVILTEMEQSSFKLLDRWSVQFTTEEDVDLSPLFTAHSPSKARPSLTTSPPVSSSSHRQQPVAPFPGPSNRANSRSSIQASTESQTYPDSVFSPQGSCSSGSDYKSVTSRSPSRSPPPVDDDCSSLDWASPEQRPGDLREGAMSNGVSNQKRLPHSSSSDSLGLNRFAGCSQPPAKVEAFHGSLAAHLSTILLGNDASSIVSSAQLLCEVIRDFMAAMVKDREHKLPMSEFVNDSLIQNCSTLREKLSNLVTTLREEADETSKPSKPPAPSPSEPGKLFKPREALMSRVSSLKKAVKAVIKTTEKVIDSPADATAEIEALVGGGQNGVGRHPPVPPQALRFSSTSSHASVVEPAPLLLQMKEVACMNNYFGIGLDAKITYQFNTAREKNPSQYKSRVKNMMRYTMYGGKEFFSNSQRYLERRIQLECDGRPIQLPQRLQGLVLLNIPSYMAGTNFWGTERGKDGFVAPAFDDKLLEVVGVTGMSQVATSKVLGIQNQRLVQCRCAKIKLLGQEKMAVQVDGEAWLQDPGVIVISHKNKARMLVKDKAFTQTLESWKMKNPSSSQSTISLPAIPLSNTLTMPDVLTTEELEMYRQMAVSVGPLVACITAEATTNSGVLRGLLPYVTKTTTSMSRVFPNNQPSETADMEHLQVFERNMKCLLQECLWWLNSTKISAEREQTMRDCVQVVESKTRKVLSVSELSQASLAQYGFRRASDTLVTTMRPSGRSWPGGIGKYSPQLPVHRERATVMVSDAAITSVTGAKNIGKEIDLWEVEDVCQWLAELGLGEYEETVMSREVTGRQLIQLQKEDFLELGITKVAHRTRLRQALQALQSSTRIVRETR